MSDLINNLNQIYATKLQIKQAIGTSSDVFADYPTYISNMQDTGYTYITANGDHDVTGYANVNVNVSVPAGYIIPVGTYTATVNGIHDITSYANVDVQVPTGSAAVLGSKTVTANGVYTASTDSLDGYDTVTVNVPSPSYIHDGLTPYTAFTVDEAISYMKAHYSAGDAQTVDSLYVKGKISYVIYSFSASYPHWRGWITNDGLQHYQVEDPTALDLDMNIYVYANFYDLYDPENYLPWDGNVNKQVSAGDDVIIYAPIKYMDNGRISTQNGKLYSHEKAMNGQLTVSQSGTYDVQNYVSAYVDVQGGAGLPTYTNVTGNLFDALVNFNEGTSYYYHDASQVLDNLQMGDNITLSSITAIQNDSLISPNDQVYEIGTATYTLNGSYTFANTGATAELEISLDDYVTRGYVRERVYKVINSSNSNTYFVSVKDYNTVDNNYGQTFRFDWEEINGNRYARINGISYPELSNLQYSQASRTWASGSNYTYNWTNYQNMTFDSTTNSYSITLAHLDLNSYNYIKFKATLADGTTVKYLNCQSNYDSLAAGQVSLSDNEPFYYLGDQNIAADITFNSATFNLNLVKENLKMAARKYTWNADSSTYVLNNSVYQDPGTTSNPSTVTSVKWTGTLDTGYYRFAVERPSTQTQYGPEFGMADTAAGVTDLVAGINEFYRINDSGTNAYTNLGYYNNPDYTDYVLSAEVSWRYSNVNNDGNDVRDSEMGLQYSQIPYGWFVYDYNGNTTSVKMKNGVTETISIPTSQTITVKTMNNEIWLNTSGVSIDTTADNTSVSLSEDMEMTATDSNITMAPGTYDITLYVDGEMGMVMSMSIKFTGINS